MQDEIEVLISIDETTGEMLISTRHHNEDASLEWYHVHATTEAL